MATQPIAPAAAKKVVTPRTTPSAVKKVMETPNPHETCFSS
jgi:hypothetical protein